MRTIEDTRLPVEMVDDDVVSALGTHDAIVAGIKRLLEQVRTIGLPAADGRDSNPKKVLIVA